MRDRKRRARVCRLPIAVDVLEPRRLFSTIYVDVNSPAATPTGASWATAYPDLQQALTAASSGDAIHIADGTYKPTASTDRSISFVLKSGVAVTGGYGGYGAANPDARDLVNTPTILSGDIGTAGTNTDNSYHVLTAGSTAAGTSIDGLTITGAYSSSSSSGGGGIYMYLGTLAISNCTLSANSAGAGGGIYVAGGLTTGGSATISGCSFSGNVGLSNGAAAIGAGLFSSVVITGCSFTSNNTQGIDAAVLGGTLTVDECTFASNIGGAIEARKALTVSNSTFTGNSTTGLYGGAINIEGGSSGVAISGCTFARNHATQFGGAVGGSLDGPLTLTRCVFDGNGGSYDGAIGIQARTGASVTCTDCAFVGNMGYYGGAIRIEGVASTPPTPTLTLDNCTFASNSGLHGGALWVEAPTSAAVTNCILYGDTSPEVYLAAKDGAPPPASITYSLVSGGFTGTGNLNADPKFVRNPSPGADGKWGTADDDYGDLRLMPNSPCIDAGSNAAVPSNVTTDLAGNARIFDFPGAHDPGAIVDMGAYEANLQLGVLHLSAGQTLALPAGGYTFSATQVVLDAGATLDLKDDALVIDYAGASPLGSWNGSAYSGVEGLVAAALHGGTGIISSVQDSHTVLGVAEASDVLGLSGGQTTTWNGQAVDATSLLIRFAYAGDANLNGAIDGDDYFQIDSHVGRPGEAVSYFNGDFNYDGRIDADDYFLIDSNVAAAQAAMGVALDGEIAPPAEKSMPAAATTDAWEALFSPDDKDLSAAK